jgi:hypothetical protein
LSVQALIEASDITIDSNEPGRSSARSLPVSFAVHEREMLGVWVPEPVAAALLLRVVLGGAPLLSGELRRRAGARIAIARPDEPLGDAFAPDPGVLLVDAGGYEPSLETWRRLALAREQGASIVVVTASALQAYRCDQVALAMWSLPDLISALESLVSSVGRATYTLLGGACTPERSASLALDLERAHRAVRDGLERARRAVTEVEDRLRVADLAASAAAVMLDERLLERWIDEAENR